jgi:hypothetical protein
MEKKSFKGWGKVKRWIIWRLFKPYLMSGKEERHLRKRK